MKFQTKIDFKPNLKVHVHLKSNCGPNKDLMTMLGR